MCLWTYEGAMSGSGSATQSCSSTPKIMPVSQFTNGQIGGCANDGATVATVPGAGCNTYDGVHITAYGNVRPWLAPASVGTAREHARHRRPGALALREP